MTPKRGSPKHKSPLSPTCLLSEPSHHPGDPAPLTLGTGLSDTRGAPHARWCLNISSSRPRARSPGNARWYLQKRPKTRARGSRRPPVLKAGAAGGDTSFTNTSAPRFSVAHAPTPSAPQISALPGVHPGASSCCGCASSYSPWDFLDLQPRGPVVGDSPRVESAAGSAKGRSEGVPGRRGDACRATRLVSGPAASKQAASELTGSSSQPPLLQKSPQTALSARRKLRGHRVGFPPGGSLGKGSSGTETSQVALGSFSGC